MSNANIADRMISSNRTIRQRCILKYLKVSTWRSEKWIDLTCIFYSFVDAHKNQRYQLELHDHNNIQEPNGRVIDLQDLHSLTYLHGRSEKNEPRDIIILEVGKRKHRLGFDENNQYIQWKSLFDSVHKASATKIQRNEPTDNATMNLLYESSDTMRCRVHFADEATKDLLRLPNEECFLVFDDTKVIIEQNQDKQYTFPRTVVRGVRLTNDTELQLECGSKAPVKGLIKFRFDTKFDAESCFRQWQGGSVEVEAPKRPPRHALTSMSSKDEDDEGPVALDDMKIPPRVPKKDPISRASTLGTAEAPPRKHKSSLYYNNTLPSTADSPSATNDDYAPFKQVVYDTSL